jgi:hypothetical protein
MNRVEQIAMVCHEANRAWCAARGDYSQPSWSQAPEWQRASAIAGVMAALDGATPEQSHSVWLEVKRDAGWVYGPVKDPYADPPTHPCMVPYEDLPPEQRVKDHLFVAIVRALDGPAAPDAATG